jgi:hypothetical protein
MAARRPRIFLSVGRQKDERRARFVATLETMLRSAGVDTVKLPNTFNNPLDKVVEELRLADGALVICFERVFARTAIEFRAAEQPGPETKPFLVPTVWNHIEAAMARTADVPVLVIAEQGCRIEGVLDPKVQLKIHWMDFEPELLAERYFQELFFSWIDAIRDVPKRREVAVDASSLRFVDILRSLKFGEVSAILVSAMTLAGAIFYAGWWFGQRFGGQ